MCDFSFVPYPPLTTIHRSASFDPTYQTTCRGSFPDDWNTSVPATATYEHSPLTPATAFNNTLYTPITHLPTEPVDPSTMAIYTPPFDHAPHISPSNDANIFSPPSVGTSTQSRCSDSSEFDSAVDYVPSPDEDDDSEEYHPTQPICYQNQKNTKTPSKAKSSCSFSPSRFTSESEKNGASLRKANRSHPYRRNAPPRNLQCEGPVSYTNTGSDFRCPVVGCDHTQENRRIPDLKRHILTHRRLVEPEKWICCGVGMERAHLYREGIKQGMTDEERIKAGADEFGGRLTIGGCMKTFSRKDALKRHVDNSKGHCLMPAGSH